MTLTEIAVAVNVPKENMFKWYNGTRPSDPVVYNKLMHYLDSLLEAGSFLDSMDGNHQFIKYKIKSGFFSVDDFIEVTDDSMAPVFIKGCRVAVIPLKLPLMLEWGKYYFLVDINGCGIVRRIYPGDSEASIKLVSGNEENYPTIIRTWDKVQEIYKVVGGITFS